VETRVAVPSSGSWYLCGRAGELDLTSCGVDLITCDLRANGEGETMGELFPIPCAFFCLLLGNMPARCGALIFSEYIMLRECKYHREYLRICFC
jgi:hypothetical protein